MELSPQHRSIILIVDDTSLGRDNLESVLYGADYQLAFAQSGVEALNKAEELKPDLILLDIMMPEMDGFEVCSRIRATPQLADIPVILVTALDDRAARIRGIEAGADDFISKPVDRAEMRARVRTITRLNRYRRMLDERTRFTWVVEHAEDGYLMIDGHDKIQYANLSARRLLNLEPEVGLHEVSFLQTAKQIYRCEPESDWRNWPASAVYALPEAPALNVESPPAFYLIRPESSFASAAWLQVHVLRQPDNVSATLLVRLRNVTTQMVNRRDMFTFHSLVMHKLNTPLHLLLASIEMLAGEFATGRSTNMRDLWEMTVNGANRLREVVNDILGFLSLPSLSDFSEHMTLKRLPNLVTQITNNLKMSAVEVKLSAPANTRILWSERVMEIVVMELLENSRKFHPTQSPNVLIEAMLHKAKAGEFSSKVGDNRRARQIALRISDNGKTLTPEQLRQAWAPYYQAERYFTGEVPGMGLGLALVASLVWEANGDCRIYNRSDGVGIVVELILPVLDTGRERGE
jgi:CheY-like chemotaxis protein